LVLVFHGSGLDAPVFGSDGHLVFSRTELLASLGVNLDKFAVEWKVHTVGFLEG
jgi:hypothetical protein